jgi:hypothetical protein
MKSIEVVYMLSPRIFVFKGAHFEVNREVFLLLQSVMTYIEGV